MKICVLGSNSFCGSSYVDQSLRLGHEVLAVSRRPELGPEFLQYISNPNAESQLHFVEYDLNQGTNGQLAVELEKFKPNIVLNFAAQGMVAESWLNPLDWYSTNVIAMVGLHQFLLNVDWLDTFVHFTTPEVYGSNSTWIAENWNLSPTTPYANSRACFDMHLKNSYEHQGFPVVFTRTANVYGPSQQLYRVIPKAILAALLGRRFHLDGGGFSRRSFIFHSDVSNALKLIAENARLGDTYHISTDELISIKDLVYLIFNLLEADLDLITTGEDRLGKDDLYALDSQKLKSELGWYPQVGLNFGIEKTVEWAKRHLDVFSSCSFEYKHIR